MSSHGGSVNSGPGPSPSSPSFSPMPVDGISKKASSRYHIFPVMFAQFFALGLLRPEMPGLLLQLFSGDMRRVALFQGSTDALGAIVAFLVVPALGAFSDKHGRKTALAISHVCAAAPTCVMASYGRWTGANATSEQQTINQVLNWILCALNSRILTFGDQMSLLVGFIFLYVVVSLVSKLNSYSIALSYVSDCTSLVDRSSAFAEVSGVMFLGLTVGPLVDSYLDRDTALLVASLLALGAAVYIFFMPESHAAAARAAQGPSNDSERAGLLEAGRGSSSSSLSYGSHGKSESTDEHPTSAAHPTDKKKESFLDTLLIGFTFLRSKPLYTLIALITFLSQFAVFGVGQIYYLYLVEELGFSREDNIHAALIGGVETSFLMLLVMPALSHRAHESLMMGAGLSAYAIYAMGLALAVTTRPQAFALILFWAISGTTFPSTCSLLSAHTSSDQTGLAQGALSAIRSCASGLGPALFALFFSFMVQLKHDELGAGPIDAIHDTAAVHWGPLVVRYTALPLMFGALLIIISLILTMYLPMKRIFTGAGSAVAAKLQAAVSKIEAARPGDHPDKSALSDPQASPTNLHIPFVRRKDGGHIVPAVSGHFTFHEQWQHLRAHTFDRNRKVPRMRTVAEEALADAVARPPARSARSRWSWLAIYTVVIVSVLVVLGWVGHHYGNETATPAVTTPSTPNSFTQMDASRMSTAHMDASSIPLFAENVVVAVDSSKNVNKKIGHMTVMALMGPPGVGKTAFARHLTATYGLVSLSSGELIRGEIERNTTLGQSIIGTVQSGGLIDDATVTQLVENRMTELAEDQSVRGVILDGYPRRLSQAQLLDRCSTDPSAGCNIPPLKTMVFIDMNEDALAERRAGRRVCPVCGRSYNLHPVNRDGVFLPARAPKVEGHCDADGAELVQRVDDREDIAAQRMKVFKEESLPMVDYYQAEGKLIAFQKTTQAGQLFKAHRTEIEAMLQIAPLKSIRQDKSVDQIHEETKDAKKIAHMTVMALMGPPGVGKTAMARHLTTAFGLTPLSSGVLIRGEISRNSTLGQSIKDIVDAGGLIDDATVTQLVENRMSELAKDKSVNGVILDGYPRRLSQAQLLDRCTTDPSAGCNIPPLATMVYIDMNEEALAERRAGRRICPVCGRSYNLHPIDRDGVFLPARAPKVEGHCDADGAELVQRVDDREDIAAQRMKVFKEESLPMVDYYRAEGKLIEIQKTTNAANLFRANEKAIAAKLKAAKNLQKASLDKPQKAH